MKRKERIKDEKAKKKRAMSPKVARRFLARNLWKMTKGDPKPALVRRAKVCIRVLKKHEKEKEK